MEKVVFIDSTVPYDMRFEDEFLKLCPDVLVVYLVNSGEDNMKDYLELNPETEFIIVTARGKFSPEYHDSIVRFDPKKGIIQTVCKQIADVFSKYGS